MFIYIYLLIALTGILTTYTDIRKGKIKNIDLAIVLVLAIVLYSIFIIAGTFKVSLIIVINLLSGLTLGFIFYIFNVWKAGDAKLFFLYSLLLMENKNSYTLFLPCLALFANIFLVSFLALLPLLLKDILYHKKDFFKYIISKNSFISFIKTWAIMFSISFFIGPLIASYVSYNNIIVSLTFILISYLICRFLRKAKYIMLLVLILIIGIVLKLSVAPGFLSLKQMADFIKYTAGYSAIAICIAYIISSEKNKYIRIPFAPFMLLGAFLSTTHFLEQIIMALRYLK